MARFVREVRLFFAIQAAVLLVLALTFYRPDPNAYAGVMVDKNRLLETQPSPRLIMVGGSSFAFGVLSPVLQLELALNPVNLGWFAGLGPDFMLNWAEAHVRPGDVALVSLEYEHFALDLDPGLQVIQILELEPRLARFLSADQWRILADHGVLRYLGHVTRNLKRRRREAGGREAYNAFGDVADFDRKASDPLDPPGTMRVPRPGGRLDATVGHLARFRAACEARGAVALFTFPPVTDTWFGRNEPAARAVERALVRSEAIPLVDGAIDGVQPERFFSGTAYHLTGEGAQNRTRHLVAAVRRALAARPPPGPGPQRP